MSDTKNIYQRINEVMKEISYVKKDAIVERYKAVTHDQVVSVARDSLVKHGIVIYPEQVGDNMPILRDPERGIKMHLYSGDYIINFVNIDNPDDRIKVTVNAHANDNGDKAPGKAITYATKTAILKVLCLETGENDESRTEKLKPISEVQEKALRSALGDDSERIIKFCTHYGLESLSELPKENFDKALALINKSNSQVKS